MMRAAPRQIASVVAGLFLRFPSVANAPDQDARIAAYVSDLASFPLWAIEEAATKASGQFAPSSAQLVESAREACRHIADEQATIGRILQADAVGDTSRLPRVDDGFEKLRRDLYGDVGKETISQAQENAEKALAKIALSPEPLPPMSDALKALVKRQTA